MKRFFELTFRPFFVIAGAATAAAGLAALWPRWTVETVSRIAFVPDYTIFVRHWGITVGLAGVFMIAAVFREGWRKPVLLYAAIEKALFVLLCVRGAGEPYAAGFSMPAVLDALVVLYIIAYFWTTAHQAAVLPAPDSPAH
jgi:hypothetical protein